MRRSELDYILAMMLGLDRQTETVIRRRRDVSDLELHRGQAAANRAGRRTHPGQLLSARREIDARIRPK